MKKRLIRDLIFYLFIPLFIWNYGQNVLGKYYAMLLSSTPGFIYSFYTWYKDKKYNISGFFILVTLLLGTIIDLISGSAEQMLINDIYYGIAMSIFWFVTIAIKKPMLLYFFTDYSELEGYNRKDSLVFFKSKYLFKYFQGLTALYGITTLIKVIIKLFLIEKYGVSGYNEILIIMTTINWCCSGIKAIATIALIKKVKTPSSMLH